MSPFSTHNVYASSGGQVTGGTGQYATDAYKCIPKRVGGNWKAGTYRAAQTVKVATFPYQTFTVNSDHVVYN